MASPTFFIAGAFQYPETPFIEMDATVEIVHKMTSQITDHPVEVGADISSHVRPENPVFSVKGYVSNHHVAPVIQGNVLGDSGKRTQIVYDTLKDMWQRSVLFTMVTEFDSHNNCVITSINIPQTAKNSEGLEINMEVRKLRIVAPEYLITSITVAGDKAQDSQGTKNGGTSSTTDATGSASRLARVFGQEGTLPLTGGD